MLIDEIVREGARRMLAEALQAEVDAYVAQFRDERDENGRRLVVRNGSHQPREVLTSACNASASIRRAPSRTISSINLTPSGRRGPSASAAPGTTVSTGRTLPTGVGAPILLEGPSR